MSSELGRALALERAAAARLILILGDTDTGKTSLTAALAGGLAARGLPVGVIDADLGQSQIGPPAAFNINNFDLYCNRALEFHVFAIADIPTQSANVTFEKKAFRFKLEGIKGKVFFTKAFNNPRFYFVPAKASCGRSGIIRVFYKTKQPKEKFESIIGVNMLGDAPPT